MTVDNRVLLSTEREYRLNSDTLFEVVTETFFSGPIPKLHHDMDDVDDFDDEGECIEQGDRIFASGLLPPHLSKYICASSTILIYVAEAFKANLETNAPPIPDYLKEFLDIFSKEPFDTLPEHKQWDHGIKLVSGKKPAGCKVYPLAPSEQRNWMHSLKKTWRPVRSVCLNL
jgi:hypothetical protein